MPQSQPPSFAPRRRNLRGGPLQLPAEGRQGDPPRWPLPGRQTGAERECWEELWHTPQAVAWERLGWSHEVARYCRLLVKASLPKAVPAVHGQCTALADRLGLTPKAMRMLLWTVEQLPAGEQDDAVLADELEEARRRLRPAADG